MQHRLFLDCSTQMGPTGHPETSVTN